MTRNRDLPSVQYRSPNFMSLSIRNRPEVTSYQVRGASRLEDAYGAGFGVGGGGTLPMFTVGSGQTFRSSAIQARGLGLLDETYRGLSKAIYDPDEFFVPTPPAGASGLSDDNNIVYLRLTPTLRSTGAAGPEGPIYLAPSFDFFTTPAPTYTVSSVAPNLVFPAPPPFVDSPAALHLVFPAFIQTLNLTNTSAFTLNVAFAPGQSPLQVAAGSSLNLTSVGVPEILLFSTGGNATWTGVFTFFNFL